MDGIAQWTKFLFSCKVYFNLFFQGMGFIDKKSIFIAKKSIPKNMESLKWK